MFTSIFMTQVVKRDGTLTELNIDKIKKVIDLATKDLEVNKLELESSLTTALVDGVTTRTIQDNLINNAVNFTSLEYPDWRYVAGRLLMMSIWKETVLARNYRFNEHSFSNHVISMVNKGLYDSKLLDIYSDEELDEVGSYIKYERDLDYDYAGASLLQKRYLIEGELPQEMYMTISLLLASVEKDNKLKYAKQFYDLVSTRKISLATPILLNLRKPNGNLSSCFILGINDNIDSIFNNVKNLALISKNGGGAGAYLSKIRATGSRIRNTPNASGGVLPWIKIINDTAIAVNQLGKRAGAITVALDIWHLDIEDFLECQTENGDLRKKSYDIFPQVVVQDYFFKILEANGDWYLFDPHEIRTKYEIELADLVGKEFEKTYENLSVEAYKGNIELYKVVKAKDLLKHIINTQLESGLPYLFFKDTWNKYNPNKDTGIIYCTNLCIESASNFSPDNLIHVCNLVSINYANVSEKQLEEVCTASVRILDNTIELTSEPVVEASNHNSLYRVIGVGSMGLADYLALNKKNYNTGKELINQLFEQQAYYCTKASADLAIERGSFSLFNKSEWSKGNLIGKSLNWFKENSSKYDKWEQLSNQIKSTGIRNSQISAIAPNTSSSLLQGCTASILPVYSRLYFDKNSKVSVPIAPPYIKEGRWYYQEQKETDQNVVIDIVGTSIQPWIDTGISMELVINLNMDITKKDIADMILNAWKKECKGIYYIRSIQKGIDNNCTACAN